MVYDETDIVGYYIIIYVGTHSSVIVYAYTETSRGIIGYETISYRVSNNTLNYNNIISYRLNINTDPGRRGKTYVCEIHFKIYKLI